MFSRLRQATCVCLVILLSMTLVSAHSFTDVAAGHWAEDAIAQGAELGVFNGTTATTFSPGKTMTRGTFLVMLSRLMDWDTVTPTTASFTDVPTTSWYYSEIETALANGVITTQYDTFRPKEGITREEMAVMLVRALGYTTLAGLVQDLSMPFTDVTTNRGYIAMANELGLMTGVSATVFQPNNYTTRAQTAVVLMRLYDKLTLPQDTYAIVSDWSDTAALQSQSVIALSAATLSNTATRVNPQTSSANQQTAIDTIHQNGGTALLYITASSDAMDGSASDIATLIVDYATSIGYDGVFLDVPELSSKYRTAYTQLVQAMDSALGDDILYVMTEAPAWQTTLYSGYDYANLATSADRVVLRIAPYLEAQDDFLIAPVDPIEEVYYALTHLPTTIDASKLSLLVTTTAASRTGSKGFDTWTASQLTPYLSQSTIRTSDRYDCDYLVGATTSGSSLVAWYLNGEQVADRLQLCALFGVDSVVLSDGSSLLSDVATVLP